MAKSSTVFVGNIDFDIPEEKIIEELSTIGKVVSFKMVYDRATGKSKGYGFCEYENPIIAEAAVQNLQISFNGRSLKINYTDHDTPSKMKEAIQPAGLDLDKINDILNTMDKNNLKEVILYLKRMAIDQPMKLKEILSTNTNLVVSLFQALLNLNLVEPSVVYNLMGHCFNLNEHKAMILERICQMKDEDVRMYPEEVRTKILRIKQMLLRKKDSV
ncbi:Cleavage stimulation factor subunit 2 [Astathelohania contejeani]|uniref:Cleavage stimulation factor subunit 2 n=1 Tax=Astathelohania contejeani TaxID=164912 RepID=A0ABQ7I2E1_9MICR|nr:Cleavage stimulation factor subunit 2 [Thelohania contejeani]